MRAYAKPMLVSALGAADEQCVALEPVPLGKGPPAYSEAWLQQLIQRHPALLPVDSIEPGLTPLVPIAMEVALPSGGFIDNLMVTAEGGIVVVETKLWRNPEARRVVVAQVLDYAKDLAALSYDAFEQRLRLARKESTFSLFAYVAAAGASELQEAAFVDAIQRNLRLGRMLLLIAGDGIQENAEQLAVFVAEQLGLHFTLALVEISLWQAPGGQVFVQPKVLAHTVQIERAVVRLADGVKLDAPATSRTKAGGEPKPANITTQTFYEALQSASPALPERLKAFLAEAEGLDVFPDVRRGMSLKWRAADGREFQLGFIDQAGRFNSDYVNWNAQTLGRLDLAHAYQRSIADAVPGASVRQTPSPTGWRVVKDGETLALADLLDHQTAWLTGMSDYISSLRQALG